MLNATGKVVGINTLIWGGDQGIAVPSRVANAFVNQVIEGEQGNLAKSS